MTLPSTFKKPLIGEGALKVKAEVGKIDGHHPKTKPPMTPLQLASGYCANFANSSCLGLGISDSGKTIRLWKETKCSVSSKRCPYLESSVAPHIRYLISEKWPTKNSWLQAIKRYLQQIPDPLERAKAKLNIFGPSPDDTLDSALLTNSCNSCNAPIPPRKRFCPACSKQRRRNSTRASVSKHRSSVSS